MADAPPPPLTQRRGGRGIPEPPKGNVAPDVAGQHRREPGELRSVGSTPSAGEGGGINWLEPVTKHPIPKKISKTLGGKNTELKGVRIGMDCEHRSDNVPSGGEGGGHGGRTRHTRSQAAREQWE